MGFAVTLSRAQQAVEAPSVMVEVHLSGGLPGTAIVGLPEAAVREARDRVRVAIQNTAFKYPPSRVTVNLAPAELPKHGGRFDLAIAIGILAAGGQVPANSLERCEFLGELALSGHLRAVSGVLPALLQAHKAGRTAIVPRANAEEAALLSDADVKIADNLAQVCAWLRGDTLPEPTLPTSQGALCHYPDLVDVKGQMQARRALEIAAAGGHHLLLTGPPGTGKTMLAERLPGILPPMTENEALSSCAVRSVAGLPVDLNRWQQRPFRTPHHTSSAVALVGGGSRPMPGEISLSHHGVLFLDELPEFSRHVLEVLREPLESGSITISRAAHKACYPARFQLVAAMNPCPCGYAGDKHGNCHCTPDQVTRYRGRISGPLLDRIDMGVEVPRFPVSELMRTHTPVPENSATVRARVCEVRKIAHERHVACNAMLTGQALDLACQLDANDRLWFEQALDKLKLSARAYHRILRVARTIADLDQAASHITREHLGEGLQLHRFGRT